MLGINRHKLLRFKFYNLRALWRRHIRLIFSSPAEVRFIELMGGKVYGVKKIKHWRTGFPLTIYWRYGKILRSEKFRREVRAGRYWIDLGNDIHWGFEIDGAHWHRDIVAEFDRDSYLYQRGWRIMHIDATRLWRDPSRVQRETLRFLYS
jgi:hypothetical protein